MLARQAVNPAGDRYEQLIRDLDIVREWRPDIVVVDEAQRIKNWATRTALTVKRLDPPYRLVLTGTPMENRLDELASIVEWVDDLALEPKWRFAAWHTTPVDGKSEIGGARNLDTLRTRLATCMIRRVRHEVLSQLPARTDTRSPIAMTAEQLDEHDAAQHADRTDPRPDKAATASPVDFTSVSRAQQASVPVGAGPPQHADGASFL